MKELKLNIQLFAAGDVVNSTASENLSAEMKTFYDKTLITLASPYLVNDQFGQKRDIPKNGCKIIEFRKFSSLPKALTPLTEGVTPTGNKLNVSAVSATVEQYGDYIEQTDMLELTAETLSLFPVGVTPSVRGVSALGREENFLNSIILPPFLGISRF